MPVSIAASVAAFVVAALHVVFFALESLLWTRPGVRRSFGLSAEDAERTKVLASNQGVYNAMLAVGLVWGTATGQVPTVVFLLVFVMIVGVWGAATAKPTILVVQSLPAALALGLVAFG